jgi:sulfide:quinone oxidoreductase
VPADLVLAVPLHVAPRVVQESSMTENGWIPTDKYTLKTRFPDVYAFGDVASVGVPRAGIFAEGQAKIVAAQIVAEFQARDEAVKYQGIGACYMEYGQGMIGKVEVNFLGGPTTTAELYPPSVTLRGEKKAFGSSRRARWFGM